MSRSTDTPNLGDLFRELQAATIGKLTIQLTGTVVSYDAERQEVVVRPDQNINRRVEDSADLVAEELPIVSGVPVMWNSWANGAAAVTGVLQPGDPVVLMICDRSIDEWKAATDKPYAAADIRRCHLTDAMAYPGTRPGATPLAQAVRPLASDPADTVVIARRVKLGGSAAVDPVVTESRLEAVLAARDAVFSAHTHPVAGVTAGMATVPSAPPASGYAARPAGTMAGDDVVAT